MQDKYAGDIGDFGKFALLRSLVGARRLGVCWYRTDGLGEKGADGNKLKYLLTPKRFRHLDSEVFDSFAEFVSEFQVNQLLRSVARLESLALLPKTTRFHGELCPRGSAWSDLRKTWARGMHETVKDADLVFLDPDNGLETRRCGNKSALLAEVSGLASNRPALVYHHQTRYKGGAKAECDSLKNRLQSTPGISTVSALLLTPYSARFYLLVNADQELLERFQSFADRWERECVRF
jgi:hypothetical protein